MFIFISGICIFGIGCWIRWAKKLLTCSWHQKRNHEFTNSPIHEFKVLHKGQRTFQKPYSIVYFFLINYLKKHLCLVFFILKQRWPAVKNSVVSTAFHIGLFNKSSYYNLAASKWNWLFDHWKDLEHYWNNTAQLVISILKAALYINSWIGELVVSFFDVTNRSYLDFHPTMNSTSH